MRNEIRDGVVVEVSSRLLAACLKQAHGDSGMPLDVLVNDTLYHEKKRLEIYKNTPTWGADLAFWDTVKGRLGRAGEPELRQILERIIDRFVSEIEGNFSPWVYGLSTKVLPSALPVLLNAMSPRRLMDGGVPDMRDTIILRGQMDALRRCQQQGTVILAPTHVSNLDSVVCGWALYALGLPPFTYGAGLNLFSNPVLSFFMRNLGAYRVDRTKKAPLYLDALKEYATVTMERGQSQLFFPGGTRARSGEIDQKLKLGLLSCGLRAYINNLAHAKSRPRIFIVPCTLNFHLVLEASTLIEDHLRLVGKSRYIITDDESFRPREVARFMAKLSQLDSKIFMTFGAPLDPFGNRVDEDGESVDDRGRRVDVARYVSNRDGEPCHLPQRDRVFTRDAGEAVRQAFLDNNVVLSTNLVAFTVFEHLAAGHPDMDLYRLLRTAGDGAGIDMGELSQAVRRVTNQARRLSEQGRLYLADDVAHGDPTRIIAEALRHFATYHRGGVLSRRGDRVFADDMNLVYYYRNRLTQYGLKEAVAPRAEAAA